MSQSSGRIINLTDLTARALPRTGGKWVELNTYRIYDMTNMSTLESWPVRMVWIDICWGVFLCAVTNCFAYQVSLWLS